MKENIDVNKELEKKNQAMFLNKKKIDLDTSMESLLVFYSNYATNMASDINNKVCQIRNIDPNSEQGKIYYNTITSFFFIMSKELKKIISSHIELVKVRLNTITDEEYASDLKHISVVITNQLLDYFIENASMLSNELNQDVDDEIKKKINGYIYDTLTIKMINMLKDKFTYSIRVVNNNYEENKEVIEAINEKTIK